MKKRERLMIGLWLVLLLAITPPKIMANDELSLKGEFIQGGLILGRAPRAKGVLFDGKPLRMSANGDFVFGFGRDDKGEHELVVTLMDDTTITKSIMVAKRKYQIQKIEGISTKIMNPSENSLIRIRRENASVRRARKRDDARLDFSNTFQWPMLGKITGVYGSQRVFNGVPKRPHYGVDVAAPVGTPVASPADGVVTLYDPDMFYSGGTLIIDHGHGVSSTFIHLDTALVTMGERVKRGDIIAKSGVSGRATGPHLDWRMNWFNVRLDPELIVGSMPSDSER